MLKYLKEVKIYPMIFVGIGVLIYLILNFLNVEALGNTLTLSDPYYYLSFIQENSMLANAINSTDPTTGIAALPNSYYSFRSAYHLFSALSIISGVNSTLVTLWVGAIAYATYYLSVLYCIFKLLPLKSMILKIIFIVSNALVFFAAHSITYGYLPLMNGDVTNILLLLMIVHYYINAKEDKNYLYLYLIFLTGNIAFSSSQFMIYVVFTFALIGYEVIVWKENNVKYFTLISSPLLIYAFFFISEEYSIIFGLSLALFIILCNYLFYQFPKAFQRRNIFCLATIILLITNLYGHLNPVEFTGFFLGQFQLLFEELSVINLVSNYASILRIAIVLVIPISYFMCKSNVVLKFISVMITIIFLFFFNPISAGFTVTFISGNVIQRIAAIFISDVYLFIVLDIFYEYLKIKKLNIARSVITGVICFSLALTLINVVNDLETIVKNPRESTLEEKIYKVDSSLLELVKFLDIYKNEDGERWKITVPYIIANIKFACNNIMMSDVSLLLSEYRSMNLQFDDVHEMDDKEQVAVLLTVPHYYYTDWLFQNEPDTRPDLKKMLVDSDTELFIISNWQGNPGENVLFLDYLNTFSHRIFDGEEYDIYQLYR